MPRGGVITFGDLDGKLDVLRVACRKCERKGQYHLSKLIEHARDGRLVDLKGQTTADTGRDARMTTLRSMTSAARTSQEFRAYSSIACGAQAFEDSTRTLN